MHGVGTNEDDPVAEINMIPLIDIALTLVIILMVTTVFVRSPGVALRLPETVTREGAPETNKDLVVTVAPNGILYLDGEKVEAKRLGASLKAKARGNSEARVMIKGDRKVLYDSIMVVMDAVRQAGFRKVVLPTQPPPTAQEQPKLKA
jgi:biopolymer transport protein ExbD